jgi:thioredoxin
MLKIYYFSAAWCSPCKAFGPVVEQAKSEFHDVYIQKVDADTQKDLVSKYEVNSIPKLIFEKNGTVVDVVTGAIPRVTLNQLIIKHR